MKGIVLSWLITIVLGPTLVSAQDFAAGAKPFSEPSPDGKWLFEAVWSGGSAFGGGYLSDIKEIATGRQAFEDAKSAKDEILPVRMSVAWSLDSRYARIYYYYGRVVSGDVILALFHGKWVAVDLPKPGHPRHMIHPRDRGRWIAGADIQVECGDWGEHDTITITDSMKATMVDANGQKHEITSTRERVVQFTGTTARTIYTSAPQYEDFGEYAEPRGTMPITAVCYSSCRGKALYFSEDILKRFSDLYASGDFEHREGAFDARVLQSERPLALETIGTNS